MSCPILPFPPVSSFSAQMVGKYREGMRIRNSTVGFLVHQCFKELHCRLFAFEQVLVQTALPLSTISAPTYSQICLSLALSLTELHWNSVHLRDCQHYGAARDGERVHSTFSTAPQTLFTKHKLEGKIITNFKTRVLSIKSIRVLSNRVLSQARSPAQHRAIYDYTSLPTQEAQSGGGEK